LERTPIASRTKSALRASISFGVRRLWAEAGGAHLRGA
jgi:hypothetical protein